MELHEIWRHKLIRGVWGGINLCCKSEKSAHFGRNRNEQNNKLACSLAALRKYGLRNSRRKAAVFR